MSFVLRFRRHKFAAIREDITSCLGESLYGISSVWSFVIVALQPGFHSERRVRPSSRVLRVADPSASLMVSEPRSHVRNFCQGP